MPVEGPDLHAGETETAVRDALHRFARDNLRPAAAPDQPSPEDVTENVAGMSPAPDFDNGRKDR
jgi:hypothetical protein